MGDWQENTWNNYSQGEWTDAQVNLCSSQVLLLVVFL
jgi:hypothetical protein